MLWRENKKRSSYPTRFIQAYLWLLVFNVLIYSSFPFIYWFVTRWLNLNRTWPVALTTDNIAMHFNRVRQRAQNNNYNNKPMSGMAFNVAVASDIPWMTAKWILHFKKYYVYTLSPIPYVLINFHLAVLVGRRIYFHFFPSICPWTLIHIIRENRSIQRDDDDNIAYKIRNNKLINNCGLCVVCVSLMFSIYLCISSIIEIYIRSVINLCVL